MRKSRLKREDSEEGHDAGMERWLLTYSDMITLLLALFVVLFAVSTVTPKKFLALALGLHEAFNPNASTLSSARDVPEQNSLLPKESDEPPTTTTTSTSVPGSAVSTSTTVPGTESPSERELSEVASEIERALSSNNLQADATSTVTQQGLVVQILADKVFFATDSADLGTVGTKVVDTIASVLATDSNNVVVEGFTDDQPIYGGPYKTNMELSAERAVNVVVRLYQNDGIAENRLSAIGYGETRPLVPNDSPAHMSENRRIDVVILAPGNVGP